MLAQSDPIKRRALYMEKFNLMIWFLAGANFRITELPQKMLFSLKVVKSETKIIILLLLSRLTPMALISSVKI